jgi:hypothetical protein
MTVEIIDLAIVLGLASGIVPYAQNDPLVSSSPPYPYLDASSTYQDRE